MSTSSAREISSPRRTTPLRQSSGSGSTWGSAGRARRGYSTNVRKRYDREGTREGNHDATEKGVPGDGAVRRLVDTSRARRRHSALSTVHGRAREPGDEDALLEIPDSHGLRGGETSGPRAGNLFDRILSEQGEASEGARGNPRRKIRRGGAGDARGSAPASRGLEQDRIYRTRQGVRKECRRPGRYARVPGRAAARPLGCEDRRPDVTGSREARSAEGLPPPERALHHARTSGLYPAETPVHGVRPPGHLPDRKNNETWRQGLQVNDSQAIGLLLAKRKPLLMEWFHLLRGWDSSRSDSNLGAARTRTLLIPPNAESSAFSPYCASLVDHLSLEPFRIGQLRDSLMVLGYTNLSPLGLGLENKMGRMGHETGCVPFCYLGLCVVLFMA